MIMEWQRIYFIKIVLSIFFLQAIIYTIHLLIRLQFYLNIDIPTQNKTVREMYGMIFLLFVRNDLENYFQFSTFISILIIYFRYIFPNIKRRDTQ
jgi:hypothetical protein